MIVISAGVVTNLIVAFLLVFLTAGIWGSLPSGEAKVFVNKIVAEKGESVWNSGMQEGDKILTINGSNITSGYALTTYAKNSAAYDGEIDQSTLDENLKKLQQLNPAILPDAIISKDTVVKLPQTTSENELKLDDDILKGLAFYKDNQLKLSKEQISLRDTLIGKDSYISDGNTTLSDIAYAISDNVRPLNIVVERKGQKVALKTIYPNKDGLIGIMPEVQAVGIATKTPSQIVKAGTEYLWKQTSLQIYGMYQLVTGKIPAKEMHGIVAVAKIGGDVIHDGGIPSGLLLTAIISAWLAILNFLPIPALDGGHFMFLIIEKLRGRAVSEKVMETLSTVFFVAILALALLLIFNDIYALLMHKI
jgi:regulator of sigma E protease